MSLRCIDMRLRPPIPEWVSGPTFKTAMYYPRKVNGIQGRAVGMAGVDGTSVRRDGFVGRPVRRRHGSRVVRPTWAESVTAAIVNAVKRWPDRFVGFLGIDLENISASLAEARRLWCGQPGIVGISIEPGSSTTPRLADDPALIPIYEACLEWNLPVSISLERLAQRPGRTRPVLVQPDSRTARRDALSDAAHCGVACRVAVGGPDGQHRANLPEHLRVARPIRRDCAHAVRAHVRGRCQLLPRRSYAVRHCVSDAAARRERRGLPRHGLESGHCRQDSVRQCGAAPGAAAVTRSHHRARRGRPP